MKRLISIAALLSVLMLACSLTPAPPSEAVPTDTPEGEPPVVTNLTCNELSLYLDPALASGYSCETIPESTLEFEVAPQHTKVTLQGYALADRFFEPQIAVYPVQGYSALLPDVIPGRVTALQGLIGGAAPGDSGLPFLPTFNAAQTFRARYGVLPFSSGSGIRFLTLYAQYFAPINNHDMFYAYQGLTADGQFWISVIFPASNPILPENADNPPPGYTWDDLSYNYEAYLADVVPQLESQPAAAFAPALNLLDALVGSITIQP
jgi:hypothetical protein